MVGQIGQPQNTGRLGAALRRFRGADPLVCARAPGRAADAFVTGGRSRPGVGCRRGASVPQNPDCMQSATALYYYNSDSSQPATIRMWGRLATCGRLSIGLARATE